MSLSKTKREELIGYLQEMRYDTYSNTQVIEELVRDGFSIKGYAEMSDEELITELEGYGFCEFCEDCRAELAIDDILLTDKEECPTITMNCLSVL